VLKGENKGVRKIRNREDKKVKIFKSVPSILTIGFGLKIFFPFSRLPD